MRKAKADPGLVVPLLTGANAPLSGANERGPVGGGAGQGGSAHNPQAQLRNRTSPIPQRGNTTTLPLRNLRPGGQATIAPGQPVPAGRQRDKVCGWVGTHAQAGGDVHPLAECIELNHWPSIVALKVCAGDQLWLLPGWMQALGSHLHCSAVCAAAGRRRQ
jgi:hypothetical protein